MENCPRKEAYKPLGREVRRFYVDVHTSANGRRGKPHVVFDGHQCVRTSRLVDVPAGEGDEVYVDVIPSTMYDDVSALLGRGVRVFRLKRTDIIAVYRDRLSLSKNDENDATTLSMMDRDCFIEVTAVYVELMKLVHEYYKQLSLLTLMKQLDASPELIRLARKNKDKLACRIVKKAKTTIKEYDKVCRELGLTDKSRYGKAALADLLLNVDFTAGLRKIICYVGLYNPSNGKYNHRLKTAIHSLAISYYRRQRVKAKEVRQLLKKIKQIAGGPA
ncbi:MAG: hypothetical protein QXH32_03360 [Candidatus Caldarchaeum sp.]